MSEHENEIDQRVWAEREHASHLMHIVLNHYTGHRQVILRKLELARLAARRSALHKALSQASGAWARFKLKCKIWLVPGTLPEDPLWKEITLMFAGKSIYEQDLFYIEDLLEALPGAMGELYKKISEKDGQLQKLSAGLNTKEYKEAKARIAKVQNRPNPLTGLSAEEYGHDLLSHIKALLADES